MIIYIWIILSMDPSCISIDNKSYILRSLSLSLSLARPPAHKLQPYIHTTIHRVMMPSPLHTSAWRYSRPCAQKYVGKHQSCMVTSGRFIVHAPVSCRYITDDWLSPSARVWAFLLCELALLGLRSVLASPTRFAVFPMHD